MKQLYALLICIFTVIGCATNQPSAQVSQAQQMSRTDRILEDLQTSQASRKAQSSGFGMSIYMKYSKGIDYKAYALSTNGRTVAVWGRASVSEAETDALANCNSYNTGYECRLLSAKEIAQLPEIYKSRPEDNSPMPRFQSNKEPELRSAGSGLFINKSGGVITNAHVVKDCKEIKVLHEGKSILATTIALDSQNDLALLSTQFLNTEFARLSGLRRPRLGESVVVFGYPLPSVLSSHAKVTEGSLSSLAGLGDDTRYYQISAPIQPGNSGGPLLDRYGMVIGVVTAKLSDSWTMENVGVVPQNVNFALKASTVMVFLEVQHARFSGNETRSTELSIPDIVDVADKFTVQVDCWK